uniref:Uncharacterized protein n=1 Tax=Alexandrium catenella TaxID=2925 RepID=A0A7S1RQD2_ALECA|mmetsp:Transcript_68803/g.182995  ORF Transcript_68803/g.182995 Transcript_68803/m.182995 type:complete len:278 (+) Transcript_68803:96-929(+)
MSPTKIVVFLLSLLGLAELSSRIAFGKGSVSKVRDAVATKWDDWRSEHHHHHHGGHHHMWKEAKECYKHCGADKDCHQKCPKPWDHFTKKCEMMKPILACHKACGRDPACHQKCPLPQCPRMQAVVKEALQCHGTCKDGDFQCHRACPHPLARMAHRCEHAGRMIGCHKACGFGDRACHHKCGFPFHGHHGHHGHHEDHDDVMEEKEMMKGPEHEWLQEKMERHEREHQWGWKTEKMEKMAKIAWAKGELKKIMMEGKARDQMPEEAAEAKVAMVQV